MSSKTKKFIAFAAMYVLTANIATLSIISYMSSTTFEVEIPASELNHAADGQFTPAADVTIAI